MRRYDVGVGLVRREHEDPGRVGALGQGPDRRGAIDIRHPQVHQDDVRVQGFGHGDRLRSVGRLAEHLELRVALEDPAQPVTHDRVIVDDQEPDRTHDSDPAGGAPMAGTRADIAVPPPGSDSIASVPATRLTR